MKPLQEKVEQLVMEINIVKAHLEYIGLEGGEILRPPVTAQVVEAMSARRNQAQEHYQRITYMHEALEQEVTDARVR